MAKMTAEKAIRAAQKVKHLSQTDIARLAGMTGQSSVSEYMKRDMKTSVLVRIFDALGYEIVVRPKRAGKPSKADEDSFIITDGLE